MHTSTNMKILDTNKHGDYRLVRHHGKLTIRTKAGSILVQGKSTYVLSKWRNFKNT
jgi:hypothetical protein